MARSLEDLEREAFAAGNVDLQHAYADCIEFRDRNAQLETELRDCQQKLEEERKALDIAWREYDKLKLARFGDMDTKVVIVSAVLLVLMVLLFGMGWIGPGACQ